MRGRDEEGLPRRSQRYKPLISKAARKRKESLSAGVQEIATKARQRLHSRYARLFGRGKSKQQVVTAVAREMLGFIWAIGVTMERSHVEKTKGAA